MSTILPWNISVGRTQKLGGLNILVNFGLYSFRHLAIYYVYVEGLCYVPTHCISLIEMAVVLSSVQWTFPGLLLMLIGYENPVFPQQNDNQVGVTVLLLSSP